MAPRRGVPERAPSGDEAGASPDRIATGLHKIGLVLRNAAWREHGPKRLTPTQAEILVLVAGHPDRYTLSSIAAQLGVTTPTASDSLAALERKGLVNKRRSTGTGRPLAVRPTPAGRRVARGLALWPDFLLDAVNELDVPERDVFQRALVKMIRSLQAGGKIPLARMCVGCRFFRPYAHADERAPHHCAYVNAPFGDGELRIDCADHEPLAQEEADALWLEFLTAGAASHSREESR